MAQCFEESHAAYAAHEGARAKELSEQGRAHQREMDRLNSKASEWIFSGACRGVVSACMARTDACAENNKDRRPDEVDLHGLYVKEAISFTERAINEARAQGTAKVHLIVGGCPLLLCCWHALSRMVHVGKGLHSPRGVAKLKPAIEELMQKYAYMQCSATVSLISLSFLGRVSSPS